MCKRSIIASIVRTCIRHTDHCAPKVHCTLGVLERIARFRLLITRAAECDWQPQQQYTRTCTSLHWLSGLQQDGWAEARLDSTVDSRQLRSRLTEPELHLSTLTEFSDTDEQRTSFYCIAVFVRFTFSVYTRAPRHRRKYNVWTLLFLRHELFN